MEDELVRSLKKENAALKEKVEELTQQEYQGRQNLAIAQGMNVDLENEIDELHLTLQQYEKNKKEIQSKDSEVINSLKSKVMSLEIMLQDKETSTTSEIKHLQAQLTKMKETNQIANNEASSVTEECSSRGQDEVDELLQKIDYYKSIVDTFKTDKMKLKNENYELTARLDEVASLLEAKKEEYSSCLQVLEGLKEEKALLSLELANLKCTAANDNTRGNSLFAEVDDNRKLIMAKLNAFKSKYDLLKKAFSIKNIEFNKLKEQNIRLMNELKEDKNEDFWKHKVTVYQNRISDLQETVNYYKQRPESPQIITINESDLNNLQWVTTVVENAREEAREIRKVMEAKSLQRMFDGEIHSDLLRKNKQLTTQNLINETLISDLKTKVEENQSLVKHLQQQIEGNCNLSPPIIGSDQLKLVDSKQKKIRFTEDTKEIQ